MTTQTTEFPLDSFREAAPHLRRPFTSAAVKFKVQATWPKDNPTGGLIVAYIDARLAVERLNLIVPHLWHDEYEPLGRDHLICRLTVDGITRQDVGEGSGKGLYSDALKRAAVKFGVGVSLYAIPKMTVSTNQGHAEQKRSRDGQTLALTPKGESHMRFLYEKWLEAHGAQAFGDPLDHGDALEAQGDHEVDTPTEPAPEPTAATKPEPPATTEQKVAIQQKSDELFHTPVELADAICKAVGAKPRLFPTVDDAVRWNHEKLDKLPAKYVQPILKELEAMAGIKAGAAA